MLIISLCCLVILVNQCSFCCNDYCNYVNDEYNTQKIVDNNSIYNTNILNVNRCNCLKNHKIILINTKDIKRGNPNLVNKVIICNGKILNNEKLIPGDCYKVIIKKPNHKKVFEKLINDNRNKQNTINNEEDIDVLENFRLEQISKIFESPNNNETKENIKDWREKYWVNTEHSITEFNNNQNFNNNPIDEQNVLNNSIQSNYNLDKNMRIKISRLNRLYHEFAAKQ